MDASVARVRRSMKMGDVVIQPNLEPGADVLEKVYIIVSEDLNDWYSHPCE